MKVLAVSGSLRQNSWNRKLLTLASEVLKKQGVEVEEFDLTPLPMYNGDIEAKGLPHSAISLRNAIKNADAVVIASPEYNGSMSSAIKNAVEWASRPPENVLRDKVFLSWGQAQGEVGQEGCTRTCPSQSRQKGAGSFPAPRYCCQAWPR
jgi:chromate reductase